jgi:hypothetical protein
MAVDTRRRLEDLPRSRLTEQRLGCSVVPGSTRALQFIGLVRPCAGLDPPPCVRRSKELVETRRLELLTLSLQRRCSAN